MLTACDSVTSLKPHQQAISFGKKIAGKQIWRVGPPQTPGGDVWDRAHAAEVAIKKIDEQLSDPKLPKTKRQNFERGKQVLDKVLDKLCQSLAL